MTSWLTMPQFPQDDNRDDRRTVQTKCLACGGRFGRYEEDESKVCRTCELTMSEVGRGWRCKDCGGAKESGKACRKCEEAR